MGARVFFNIKQEENLYVSLYSHWGETTKHEDLAYALDKARPRWNDVSYATRIIIDQLTSAGRDSETGYGIFASVVPIYDETAIDIDLINKTVIDDTGTHSFDSFISYHKETANAI